MSVDNGVAGTSNNRIQNSLVKTGFPVILIFRKDLRCLLRIWIKSTAKTNQRKETGAMSKTLIEMKIYEFFSIEHLTATKDIEICFTIQGLHKVFKWF